MSDTINNKLFGSEQITLHSRTQPTTVLAFWSWALSDVMSNTARGLLAEFFVASDLGVTDAMRIEWAPFDLTTRTGIRVEVKASAYLQRWKQKRATNPSFSISPTRFWDQDLGTYVGDSKRQADVYVFCLHAHQDPDTLNPLDVRQWKFFVASTALLDTYLGTQKQVTLRKLLHVGVTEVPYGEIDATIVQLMAKSGNA